MRHTASLEQRTARCLSSSSEPLAANTWDWARCCHICTGTGLANVPRVPGLGSPRPHLHWDWTRQRRSCTRAGPSSLPSFVANQSTAGSPSGSAHARHRRRRCIHPGRGRCVASSRALSALSRSDLPGHASRGMVAHGCAAARIVCCIVLRCTAHLAGALGFVSVALITLIASSTACLLCLSLPFFATDEHRRGRAGSPAPAAAAAGSIRAFALGCPASIHRAAARSTSIGAAIRRPVQGNPAADVGGVSPLPVQMWRG